MLHARGLEDIARLALRPQLLNPLIHICRTLHDGSEYLGDDSEAILHLHRPTLGMRQLSLQVFMQMLLSSILSLPNRPILWTVLEVGLV